MGLRSVPRLTLSAAPAPSCAGDLKAANIMLAQLPPAVAATVGRPYSIKVADFGQSRCAEEVEGYRYECISEPSWF